MTDEQLCDHFVGLIHKLNSQGLRIALEIKLTSNAVPYANVDKILSAIAEVLTSFLASERRDQLHRLRDEWPHAYCF